MEKYEEVNRQLANHENAITSLNNNIKTLTEVTKQLQISVKDLPDLSSSMKILIADYHNRKNKGPEVQFSYSDGESSEPKKPEYRLLDETPENMKIRIVAIHLKGRALEWHQAFMKDMEGKNISWQRVDDYNSDFNALRNQVDVPSELLLDFYLGGLPNEILHTIQLLDPKSLNQAIKLAKIQEGAYYALCGLQPPKSQLSSLEHNTQSNYLSTNTKNTISPAPTALPAPKFLPSSPHTSSNYSGTTYKRPTYNQQSSKSTTRPQTMLNQPSQNKATPIKQLSRREYDEKRRNNQCFFCNEKYVPGHKCTTNKLYMLLCPEVQDESFDGDTSADLE
ncbi:hypothetical protein CTI12_AA130250 [Artemisia annua]|uniref:Ty3 transposon capsid-like protein domain-containing protein n=1 Tax=Artemisia annua TaxID=35608 RepID=A0A2U1NRK1_ARTAN|nr:hypothetical protein CTI12_AA130250 [Artemisia annua]